MATYSSSVDKTEAGNGVKFTCTVGSGGVVPAQPVKYDGVSNNTVVKCAAIDDNCIGCARDTASSGGTTTVLSDGCLVVTTATLTIGALVEPSTGGGTQDFTSGIEFGAVRTRATGASVIRIILGI